MRITIFGAGAVGGHLAARMGETTGHDLSVVARGDNLAAIRSDGLTLTWRDGRVQTAHPRATGDVADLPEQDVVIVTLKAPALAGAAASIARLVGPATIVAFVLNGLPWWYDEALVRLDPDGKLRRAIPPDRCVGITTYSANEVVAPGRVTTHSSGRDAFLVGATGASSEHAARRVAALLAEAGIDAPFVEDLRPVLWRKLMMNASFAGVATIARLRVGDACADPELARLIRATAADIAAIAAGLGTAIDPISDDEWQAISKSTHRPSLLQDQLSGRPMEIDALFLAPLDLGCGASVETPTLRMVAAILAALDPDRNKAAG
jgi:2-dehydropantoate 2-reductase